MTVSGPEMVRTAGEFKEGFTLKVGLAWSLYPPHGHDISKGGDNTGAERKIHMECKAEWKHAQRHILRARKGLKR